MLIEIYGKKDCKACIRVKKEFRIFLKKWGLKDKHKIIFINTDTEKGMMKMNDNAVSKIPTVIILKNNHELKWWEGKVPMSKDFEEILTKEE